jgi:diaminopimelate epimerase
MELIKLHGLGNDFLVTWVEELGQISSAPDLAKRICHRKYGAGADGLIFVSRSSAADFASRVFNSDGSEAEVSGNGIRCAAGYLYQAGLWLDPQISIETRAGIKRGRLVSCSGLKFEFEFDMGEPALSSQQIPLLIDPPLERVLGYELDLGGERVKVTCLSMGNPHCVLFLEELEGFDPSALGPLIERHPLFPNRTNVEFVRVLARDQVEIRIWERGAGRTLSSGTGSCAAAIASALNGLTDRRVRVITEGGPQLVEWRDDNSVALTGPAEVIYRAYWLAD